MHQPRSTAGNGVSMICSSVSWEGSPKTQSKGKFPTTRQHAPSPGEHTSTRVKQRKPPVSAPVSLSSTPKPAGSTLSCQAKLNLVRCSRPAGGGRESYFAQCTLRTHSPTQRGKGAETGPRKASHKSDPRSHKHLCLPTELTFGSPKWA